MRLWKAEGVANTRGILFRAPFRVGDCTIFQKKNSMRIEIKVQKNDKSALEDIEKLLLKDAARVCSSLSLATERYFAFQNFGYIRETTPSTKTLAFMQTLGRVSAKLVVPLKQSSRKNAVTIFELLEKADPYALRAIDYFEKGLTLIRWNEDAFLNFFKAVELISNKYFKQANPDEIRRIFSKSKKKLTTKDKVLFMCQKLNIPSKWSSKVELLVDIRNKQDVAHAKLRSGQIDEADVHDCRGVARLAIINYLKELAGMA